MLCVYFQTRFSIEMEGKGTFCLQLFTRPVTSTTSLSLGMFFMLPHRWWLKLSGCSAALWRGGGLQQAPVKFCHCYHHILQVYYSLSLLAMRWCTRLAPALCHFWWRRCWVLQWRAPRLFKWFLLRSEFSCHWWPRLRSWRESMTPSTSLLNRVASFNRRRWQFQG